VFLIKGAKGNQRELKETIKETKGSQLKQIGSNWSKLKQLKVIKANLNQMNPNESKWSRMKANEAQKTKWNQMKLIEAKWSQLKPI